MFLSDLFSLFIAFLYVVALIVSAEILRRVFHVPVDITRKIVHVGVGMAAIAIKIVFRDWYIAIIGPLAFVLINYLSYRAGLFRGIETGEQGQLGTIYFPLVFVILTPLLWSQPPILAAALMPLTWGDAAAAILGKRFGARSFKILGQTRSLEGSFAMLVFSLLGTYFALLLFGQSAGTSLFLSFITAVLATVIEALSPKGVDNLTVPIVSAIILVTLTNLSK